MKKFRTPFLVVGELLYINTLCILCIMLTNVIKSMHHFFMDICFCQIVFRAPFFFVAICGVGGVSICNSVIEEFPYLTTFIKDM